MKNALQLVAQPELLTDRRNVTSSTEKNPYSNISSFSSMSQMTAMDDQLWLEQIDYLQRTVNDLRKSLMLAHRELSLKEALLRNFKVRELELRAIIFRK